MDVPNRNALKAQKIIAQGNRSCFAGESRPGFHVPKINSSPVGTGEDVRKTGEGREKKNPVRLVAPKSDEGGLRIVGDDMLVAP
jgi:hypothetical protein